MARRAKEEYDKGATEVHIVGGLHPKLPFDYYVEMVSTLRKTCPNLAVKAFTAIEIRHLAERIAKKPIRETLEILRDAGLTRSPAAARKSSTPRCATNFAAARKAPTSGSRSIAPGTRWASAAPAPCSTATSRRPRIALTTCAACANCRTRRAASPPSLPFAYEPENNKLSHLGLARASAFEDLRNLAIARLFLDNFDHVTAYWVSLGLPTAQIALSYGVDDLHGTIQQEKIFHMAGSQTPQGQTKAKLEHAIREAGRIPPSATRSTAPSTSAKSRARFCPTRRIKRACSFKK